MTLGHIDAICSDLLVVKQDSVTSCNIELISHVLAGQYLEVSHA